MGMPAKNVDLGIPIGASVRRIESDDCSTSSMISNFSDAEYLMKRPPHPRERFFEQAVFDQELSQGLLELARLSFELLDLVRGGLTRRVAGEPFLARLQELLRPTVVQVLIDPFLAAQLSNAVLAAQAFQHDADLLFSGMMPACGSANIPDCLFSALRYALIPACGDIDSCAHAPCRGKTPISPWTAGRFCNGCLGGGAGSMSQGLRVLV